MGLFEPFERTRGLTAAEKSLAWNVFWDTIPYNRILIGNAFGYEERAWMESTDLPGIFSGDIYTLHLGTVGFQDATSTAQIYGGDNERQVRHTFIHELTHVWQSYKKGQWVLTRSYYNQLCGKINDTDPYKLVDYDLEWNDYNVEQQAKIVEFWFRGGMSEDAKFYAHIRDYIRNC